MTFQRRLAQLDLVGILAMVVLLELALNRLAVPELRPNGSYLPTWHKWLDIIGLFIFHLSSVLALGTLAWKLVEVVLRNDLFALPARATLGAVGGIFLVIAAWSVFLRAPVYLSFHLETSFIVTLLLTWMALVLMPGDLLVKVGLLLLIVPFALHYYSTFALRFLMDPATGRGSPLPDRIREVGQWSIAFSALAVQICFAPRPWYRNALKPIPLLVAGFVGGVAAVVLRRRYDVGMEIASRGLGIELGPAAPMSLLALYVLAAAAAAWTLTATLGSESPARRQIGAGFGLVVCGGYGFAWPLQFLAVAVGALAIAEAGVRVVAEEQDMPPVVPPPVRRGPVVSESAWRGYVDALAKHIGASDVRMAEETLLTGTRGARPFALRIGRAGHGVHTVEITFGHVPEDEPALTLLGRLEGALWSVHPSPPPTSAPSGRASDAAFDRRFRIQDRGGLVRKYLDEPTRARAAALIDGWVAVWPGQGVRYRVHPGRGAPVDHPIPIPALALEMGDPDSATERLVRVFDLLDEVAEKVLAG